MKNLITCLTVSMLSGVAVAEIHHVPADFPTIQHAVDAALDGDEIIVAPGKYTSSADSAEEVVDTRGKELWLHSSGGPEVTIIDGEGLRRGILCNSNESAETIIEGFTITNGFVEGNDDGAGMYCYGGVTPYIKSCTFINNSSEDQGGGMHVYNECTPILDDCTFTNNTANYGGGLSTSFKGNPILTNCTFTNNAADYGGGGIYNYYTSSPTLTNCTFTNNTANYGGGIAQALYSTITLTNCIFENNSVNLSGGGIYSTSATSYISTFTNCTFRNNLAAVDGGGIWIGNSTITGCTMMQNTASNGGGIYTDGVSGSPTISNTNFCENNPDAIYGNWNNKGGNEFLNNCGDIEGACCVKDSCYEVELIFCESIGGDWLGYNATCEEDSCVEPPQYGACCINGEAIPLYDYDCNRILGTFMGEGTNPDDVTCPVHCAEDVTGDGVVDVSDLLAIIAVWGACP